MPVAGYRPAGSRPAVIANCFSLRARAGESKTDRIEKVKSCCFPGKAYPGAVAKVAYKHLHLRNLRHMSRKGRERYLLNCNLPVHST